MTFFGKALRAVAVILALGAGSMHAKPAKADGGAIIAGVAGGLILGAIIGSSANANTAYHAPVKQYHAPAAQPVYHAPRTYYAPAPVYAPAPRYYSRPNVTFTFGSYYGGHKKYRHRGHGYRHHYKPRRHYRRHHRGHHRGHYRHHRRH